MDVIRALIILVNYATNCGFVHVFAKVIIKRSWTWPFLLKKIKTRSRPKPKSESKSLVLSAENHLSNICWTNPLWLPPHRKEDSKEADTEKEAAMEAELKAARERAVVPLEARMTQFKDMLLERGVKPNLYL